jgi:hypothetical protein
MIGFSPVQSTSVDGIPPGVLPPSKINGMRPLSCSYTSCAVVGLAPPEMFAEVTAIGPAAQQGARIGVVGDADCDGGSGGNCRGESLLFGDDAGQGSGPEAGGKTESHVRDVVRNFIEIAQVPDQNGNRFFDGAVFGGVDAFDGGVVEGERAETVDGVGGEGDDAAVLQNIKRRWISNAGMISFSWQTISRMRL